MSSESLFRMDDFLLKAALYLGLGIALAIAGVVVAVSDHGVVVPSGFRLALGVFALAPIAMAIVGFRIRGREKRAVSLWKLIDREVEVSSTDLMRGSDWTEPHLDRAIRDLNNAGVAYVVWDRKSNLVQDGRLRRSTFVVDECTSCGGKISTEVRVGQAGALRCPYCHDPIDSTRIAEEKSRLLDELGGDSQTSSPNQEPVAESEFSVLIFLLLFGVFWPAALWYCLKHRQSLMSLVR